MAVWSVYGLGVVLNFDGCLRLMYNTITVDPVLRALQVRAHERFRVHREAFGPIWRPLLYSKQWKG